jgi:DNA-binding NarL/FixJ family response regulator
MMLVFEKTNWDSERQNPLTLREQMVLDCLAKGLTYKQIGDMLGISINTIRTHLQHIYRKLHVQSRTEAVAKYVRR